MNYLVKSRKSFFGHEIVTKRHPKATVASHLQLARACAYGKYVEAAPIACAWKQNKTHHGILERTVNLFSSEKTRDLRQEWAHTLQSNGGEFVQL